MNRSSENSYRQSPLAEITTYQSGVVQSSAFRVVKQLTANVLEQYDLTCMQWFTIGTVLDAGANGIRMSDLAKQLDTTLAYMTNTVNLLESRGIVIKRPDQQDRRTKIISIDGSYKKYCGRIESNLRRSLREALYANISPAELTTYIKVLHKLSASR